MKIAIEKAEYQQEFRIKLLFSDKSEQVVDFAEAILARSDMPVTDRLFQRAGRLVRVGVLPVPGTCTAMLSKVGFIAKEQDEESSYFQLGVRQYDPAIGRFLSVDPCSHSRGWESFRNYNPYHI